MSSAVPSADQIGSTKRTWDADSAALSCGTQDNVEEEAAFASLEPARGQDGPWKVNMVGSSFCKRLESRGWGRYGTIQFSYIQEIKPIRNFC